MDINQWDKGYQAYIEGKSCFMTDHPDFIFGWLSAQADWEELIDIDCERQVEDVVDCERTTDWRI